MITILNKELKSYFKSPIAYIFMCIFLLFNGIFFSLGNILTEKPNAYYNSVLSSMSLVFLLIVPILTMRIIAEETKTKTDQLLLTSSKSISKIVLGKYFAAVALFLITLLISTIYPIILAILGTVSVAEIFTGYLGFFLMGCCFIAIGIFISSLTDNVVVAAVGTFGALLLIWIIDLIKQVLPTSINSGVIFSIILVFIIVTMIYASTKNILVAVITSIVSLIVLIISYLTKKSLFEGLTYKVFDSFSLLKRNNMFSMGILSVDSIVYFISFSFIFIFLTIVMIEKRRWS